MMRPPKASALRWWMLMLLSPNISEGPMQNHMVRSKQIFIWNERGVNKDLDLSNYQRHSSTKLLLIIPNSAVSVLFVTQVQEEASEAPQISSFLQRRRISSPIILDPPASLSSMDIWSV